GYRISRDGVVIGTVAANATSFSDNGTTSGVTHQYCVRAFAAADSSNPVCDAGVTVAAGADPTATEHASKRITAGNENSGASISGAHLRDRFGYSLGGDGTRLIVGLPGSFSDPCNPTDCYNNQQDFRVMVFVKQDSLYVSEKVMGDAIVGSSGRLS